MRKPKRAAPSPTPEPTFGRAVVGAVGDLHTGSMFGLCPPTGIKRDGGGVYLPNPKQVWLWGKWLDLWSYFYSIDPTAPHIVIVNAEFIDGNHHGTTEIATPDEGEMIDAALQVMAPAMAGKPRLLVTRGTEAHSGKAGRIDDSIAKALGAIPDPETGASSFQQLFFETCGVAFDVAHHVGGNRVPHMRGNNVRAEVNQAIHDAAELRERAPDILIRSHVHNPADTGFTFATWGVVLPAWQLKTAYAQRVTRSRVQWVGGLICELADGQYQRRPTYWKAPIAKPIVL